MLSSMSRHHLIKRCQRLNSLGSTIPRTLIDMSHLHMSTPTSHGWARVTLIVMMTLQSLPPSPNVHLHLLLPTPLPLLSSHPLLSLSLYLHQTQTPSLKYCWKNLHQCLHIHGNMYALRRVDTTRQLKMHWTTMTILGDVGVVFVSATDPELWTYKQAM